MTLASKQRILILTAMILGLVAYAFALSRPSGKVDAASDTACVLPDGDSSVQNVSNQENLNTSTSSTTTKKVVKHHNHNLVNVDNVLNDNNILNDNNVSVLNDLVDVTGNTVNVDVVDDVTATVDAVVGDVL